MRRSQEPCECIIIKHKMLNKRAYFWGIVNRFAPIAIQVVSNMVLARYLTPEDFGTIGVLNIFLAVAAALIDSGLGGSLIKEEIVTDTDCNTIATFNFFTSIVLYIIIFAFSGLIEAFYQIPSLAKITRLVSLTFIINSIGLVPKAIMTKKLKFKTLCNVAILGVFIGSAVSITMAIVGCGVYALVAYPIINAVVNTLAVLLMERYSFRFAFSVSSLKKLAPFGIYTTLTSIIDTVYENLLTSLTGKYLDVTRAGYLTQAKKIEEGLTTSVASALGNVSFPILTKLKGNAELFRKEADSLQKNVALLFTPILMLVAIFSDDICSLVFGQAWQPAGIYLTALIFAGIFLIQETLIRSYIKSLCAVKELMQITVLKRSIGIGVIIGTLILDPDIMLYGYVFSTFIGLLLNVGLYSRLMDTSFIKQTFDIIKPLLPSVLFFILVKFSVSNMDSPLCMYAIALTITILYYAFLLIIRRLCHRK